MPVIPDTLLDGRLKLRHIRIALAIAEQGTLTRAASKLYVTQPVVTRALSEVEEILGNEIFERTPKGITVTEFGGHFLRDAAVITARLRDLQRRIDLRADGLSGRVIIGNHLMGSTSVLPRAIAEMKSTCPEVTVTLREVPPDQLTQLLRSGAVDLVMGRLSGKFLDPDFTQEELYREQIRVVARAGHPLASAERLMLKDLQDQNWILPLPETSLRIEMERCFAEEGVPMPRHPIECTGAVMMQSIVLAGDTIAVMPELVAKSAGLEMLPVDLPVTRSVGIVKLRERENSPVAERFIEELRAQSRNHEARTET